MKLLYTMFMTMLLTCVTLGQTATVTTDRDDYYPGDTVLVTGSGWLPGETVMLEIVETPLLHAAETLYTVADGAGEIYSDGYIIESHDLGQAFTLTAFGLTSQRIAQALFTDSPRVGSVTVGTQTPSPVCQGDSSTFLVTVTRGSGQGSSGSVNANLTIVGSLPPGATASFSPAQVSFAGQTTSGTSVLKITTTVGLTPDGTYSFQVKGTQSNNANDNATSAPVSFTVNAGPTVSSHPSSQTVCAGSATSLTVMALGTGLTYQWRKNGAPLANGGNISGATSSTLTIDPTEAIDAGSYDVVVSGTCSPAAESNTATLTVNVPPVITGQPSDQTVCAPGSASFSVTASGTGLTFQWRKNGLNLSDGGSISGANSSTLIIGPASLADAGSYDVVVSGIAPCSPVVSLSATLTVNSAPAVTTHPMDQDVCAGNSVSFSATASGTPAPVLQWEVSSDHGATWTNTGSGISPLVFTADAEKNGYRYRAVFTNVCGSVTTDEAMLGVGTPPSIVSLPPNITVNSDAGVCGAIVVFESAIASGSPAPAMTYSEESGSFFPIGSTTVTVTAINACGSSSESFTVTVIDNTPPQMTCQSNLQFSSLTGLCVSASGLFNDGTIQSPTVVDNCPDEVQLLITRSDRTDMPKQSTGFLNGAYPVGTTTITWYATDAAGNTDSCFQSITVIDNEPPSITAPANIVQSNDPGQCYATVNLGSPSVSDNCGVQSVAHDGPATFPVGVTTVTWTATDIHGNTNTAQQLVTVNDTEGPVVSCPANITASNDPGTCSATVSFGVTSTDNCGIQSTIYKIGESTITSPYAFPVGTSTVNVTVTDVHGNVAGCTFTVMVGDNENPQPNCPQSITVGNDPGNCSASVSFAASPTDNCGVQDTLYKIGSTAIASPYLFPVGTTTVDVMVTDVHGNTASCDFSITVEDNEPPSIIPPPSIVQSNDPGQCYATVTLGWPSVDDNCGVQSVVHDAPASFPVGVTTVTWTVMDNHGNTNTAQQLVTINDTENPLPNCPEDITVNNDQGVCSAIVSFAAAPTDNCAIAETVYKINGSTVSSPYTFPVGTTTVDVTVTDMHGNSATCSFSVEVEDNEAPVITPHNNITTNVNTNACGAVVTFNPVATDNCEVQSVVANPQSGSTFPIGETTVYIMATDVHGNSSNSNFTVTVYNTAPVAHSITAPLEPVRVNTAIAVSGSFTDLDLPNQNVTATWHWGDNTSNPATITGSGTTLNVTGTHTYATAGVYSIELLVEDGCGVLSRSYFNYVVIYDPEGGFVTGGGWIMSPAGAYTPDPSLTGRANFGFVSKYKKGANVPEGNTEFQFQVANVNFKSTAYQWLVISGAKAQYKGDGKINNSGNYGFLLSAVDGQRNGGGGTDRFRIKIWDKNSGNMIVYDNQMGAEDTTAASTVIGGGSIVVHTQGGPAKAGAEDELIPEEYALFQNFPNPFNPSTRIRFDLPEPSSVRVVIYDVTGREIQVLHNGRYNTGRYEQLWDGRDAAGIQVASGIYFCRIDAKSLESERNLVTVRKMLLLK